MKLYILSLLLLLFSCDNSEREKAAEEKQINKLNESTKQSGNQYAYEPYIPKEDPYEVMHVVFVGEPEISEIKPLVEGLLKKYNLPETDEYRNKISSMVFELRKTSAVGVTEMDLLKHIYQTGSTEITIAEQAGISSVILERSK